MKKFTQLWYFRSTFRKGSCFIVIYSLYTAPAVLPSGLHTADGLDNKKYDENFFLKNITYFLYFSGLSRVWNLRKRVEEFMNAYRVMTADLFTSAISRDSAWYLNMAAFINTSIRGWQLTSSQLPKYSFQLVTRYFLLLSFCPLFP